MHKIKQIPEDFIVKEVNDIRLNDAGQYSYFSLKKRNYNTLRAVQQIAEKLRLNVKNIGFAGNKDKNAITEQVISIKNGNKNIENIKIKDIELKYLGKGNEEIYLGNLKGNDFIITIRNLDKKEIKNLDEKVREGISMPNYFGQQRFSNNNAQIGKAIIKNSFKEAIDLIIKSNSDCNEKIESHLEKQKNDFVGAIKIIPFKMLKFYVHSYQSFLFNKALEQYIKFNKNISNNNKKTIKNINNYNNKKLNSGTNNEIENIENKNLLSNETNDIELINNVKIPIIGFATEIENPIIIKIINKIIKKENIDFRDFIIRPIPDLSLEGSERDTLIKINNFEIIKIEKDELNQNKEKITVRFSLPKGAYATVFVGFLFS